MRLGVLCLLLSVSGCLTEVTALQGGLGPMVGYVPGRGFSAGWEGGGAMVHGKNDLDIPNLYLHFNGGMSWRPGSRSELPSDLLGYLVWEPVLGIVPVTLGYGYSSEEGSRPAVGAWLGALAPVRRSCSEKCLSASVAVGYRWSGVGEFYLAPKLGAMWSWSNAVD